MTEQSADKAGAWTPGPWFVAGERYPSLGQRIAATIDGSTFTICNAETPIQGGCPRHDMREANAALIAAAPDLYEFAEWAFRNAIDRATVERARDVLAKAGHSA